MSDQVSEYVKEILIKLTIIRNKPSVDTSKIDDIFEDLQKQFPEAYALMRETQ